MAAVPIQSKDEKHDPNDYRELHLPMGSSTSKRKLNKLFYTGGQRQLSAFLGDEYENNTLYHGCKMHPALFKYLRWKLAQVYLCDLPYLFPS